MPTSLNIRTEIDSTAATERLDKLRTKDVPDHRQQLTRNVMREVLRRTIARHPVDTGRSRAAWSAALTQLGGTPPAGRPGNDAEAIAEGTESVEVTQTHTPTASQIEVTNEVDYEPLLEFGTRNMSPFHMVERAITDTRQNLRNLAPNL